MAEKTNETVESGQQEELFTREQVDELVGKERESWETKLREVEKVSQMDAKQKEDYLKKQAESALSAREAAVAKRELAADAAEKLNEYKLPKSLLSCVNFASPEDCEAVSQRIGNAAPKLAAGNAKDAFLDGLFD